MKMYLLFALLIGSVISTACAANLTSGEQAEMVAAHNEWRREVNVSPLIWSAPLADTAQAYADKLKAARGCNPVHGGAKRLGENLYWASALKYSGGTTKAQTITPTQVANAWGSEKANYNYSTNTCARGKACGHYTQMVWESTDKVGCGKAVCRDDSQVWVCNYKPSGNIVGRKPY
jgi:pathogenesis-related protein 1